MRRKWLPVPLLLALLVGTGLLLLAHAPVAWAAASRLPGGNEQQVRVPACDPGTCPAPGSPTLPDADNAGFTGFCTGAASAPCARIAQFFHAWSAQLALALALSGTLAALAGLLQSGGAGQERGAVAAWAQLFGRLQATLLVSFLGWRLGALLQVVETLWRTHTSEGVFAANGLPVPPVLFFDNAYAVLFLVLVQLFLFWLGLRIVFASLVGVAALAGLSRRTFGEVLREQVLWLALGALVVAGSVVLSGFYLVAF